MPIPVATPTPTPLPNTAESQGSDSELHFTGNEKKQSNDDGSATIWQEYQFGPGGPKIWLQRGKTAPTNIKS